MSLGWTEILLIIALVLLLFGATRLPAALGGLGKGIREFKKALREDEKDDVLALPPVARHLQSCIGKKVYLGENGRLEVGGDKGDTLVGIDAEWLYTKNEASSGRIALTKVVEIIEH